MPGAPWRRWASKARPYLRPLPFVLGFSWAVAAHRGSDVDVHALTPAAAIASTLTHRGLACDAEDVTWIDGPDGVAGALAGEARALVRAHASGEADDLYVVRARRAPGGQVLEVGGTWDITNTDGAEESRPLVRGALAAYTTSVDGLVTGLHVVDLEGRPAGANAELTRVQRGQTALTNLQQTGQTAGVVADVYALEPVARAAPFAWRADGTLEVAPDDHEVVIDPAATRVVEGESFVRVVPDERARPGNVVTWAVDRVRAMPWFGDENMQMLKAVAFTALDKANATFSNGTTAQEVSDELGLPSAGPAAAPVFTDPEVGWPPAPMKLAVSPPLPGEGQWIGLDKDPFITPAPDGASSAFVTSFVRPDVHRQDVRVYVTLWDPRQIALHMEAGTVEPIGASGEHGPGLIPRTPEVMRHVVAAFNGGFQAQHGEYGMSANGIEYLPPKPYAATVVELRDGSNGFGAWPAASSVPDDVVAYRQNLTALVQNGSFNPWGRTWWGGTPPGWPDQIHSARSALCLTSDGFVGYFYSMSISADDLAQGMLLARCSFGIHLDMNPGHAGFEFYDVGMQGSFAPLGRPLQSEWEAEGKVPDMAGYVFRSRRMIRAMGHMLFPRYIQREARDFFYLTARAVLPGARIAGTTDPEDGTWRTQGLPQHGFPYAMATTSVHVGGVKLRVVRADPRTMQPAGAATASDGAGGAVAAGAGATVLAFAAPLHGSHSLWWSGGGFAIADRAPAKDASLLAAGYGLRDAPGATAHAAAGVQDEDGMLVWVDLPPDIKPDATTAAAMDGLLERMGCSTRIAMPGDARLVLGGSLDVAGDPIALPLPHTAVLVRGRAPDAHAVFESTPVVPVSVWQPLQQKRVRYFYKPAASPSASASASAGTPASAPPAPPPAPGAANMATVAGAGANGRTPRAR